MTISLNQVGCNYGSTYLNPMVMTTKKPEIDVQKLK